MLHYIIVRADYYFRYIIGLAIACISIAAVSLISTYSYRIVVRLASFLNEISCQNYRLISHKIFAFHFSASCTSYLFKLG